MNPGPRGPLFALALSAIAAGIPALAQPISVAYTPPARQAPLGSTFVDWDSLAPRQTPSGRYYSVFDDATRTLEKLEVHVTTLNPGMSPHPPHHHPWEEILLVREGNVEASINGQRRRAGPGALVFFAAHDVHSLTNVGDQPATYVVINFCAATLRTVRDQPAAEWAPPSTLSSRVIDCDRLPATPTPAGSRRDVVDSPTVTLARLESHVSTLAPGKGTPSRLRDPCDELFVVTSGVLEATVNGTAHRIGAGSLFFVASNDEHSMANAGANPASYQVFRVATDKTAPDRGG